MANASVTCRCRICGEEFTVARVCKNRKEADSWEEWAVNHYDTCDDCRKRLAGITADIKPDMGLVKRGIPQLKITFSGDTYNRRDELKALGCKWDGYAWVLKVNAQDIGQTIESLFEYGNIRIIPEEWLDPDKREYAIQRIEDESRQLGDMNAEAEAKAREREKKKADEAAEKRRAQLEEQISRTAVPEDCNDEKATIVIFGDALQFRARKNETFRAIMHAYGCYWEYGLEAWKKKVSEFTTAEDLAAEIGAALLAKGFEVEFPTVNAKTAAISGSFKKEPQRVIYYNAKDDCFRIKWKGKDDRLYEAARKVKGSRWNHDVKSVDIPSRHYLQLADFAELYDFTFSANATRQIDALRSTVPTTCTPKEAKIKIGDNAEEKLRRSLETGGTIIEDLLDD